MVSKHRDRSRSRSHGRDRDRDRRSRKSRSRSRPRHRSSSKNRSRRSRSRSYDRHSRRDKDRYSSSRSKRHSRSRDKSGERSRHRDSSRDRRTPDKSVAPMTSDALAFQAAQNQLFETLSNIATATSRNFASLVTAANVAPPPPTVREEMFSTNSNTSVASNGSGTVQATESEQDKEDRRARKRKSRWGGNDNDKIFIPGMPTVLPNYLSRDQEQMYLLQLQIEEISRKLRSGDLGISPNPEERSPSPEPIYSSDGKRLNTREFRTRARLEKDRHNLVTKMLEINPDFKPPIDYKPPVTRVNDKVMIPQEEHPEINFVGLLIGPRGNTLKTMEKETGAKIIIRGKGSVKEGKVGRKDGQPLPGEDEPLHAYITATNLESVKKAVEKIKEIIRQGVEVPESQNDLRRMQLRELALLNGTLRENDGPRCTNCGAADHKSWLCPDKPNVTNNIVCSSCGGAGHITKDCRQKRPGMGGPPTPGTDRAKIDEEYMSLMAELGEGPPPPPSGTGNKSGSRPNNFSGLFDQSGGAPRALMPPTNLPPPLLPPPGNSGSNSGSSIKGGWPQKNSSKANNNANNMGSNWPMPLMNWNQSGNNSSMPPPPPGMMQTPPPPGSMSGPNSYMNIPPLLPWMNNTVPMGNTTMGMNSMGSMGAQPPLPGATGGTSKMGSSMNVMPVPPPMPWLSTNLPPPPPPGSGPNASNCLASLPGLLSAPPPPPPS